MEKILVAVDGSENAERALMKAKQIGTAFSSEITILYVLEGVMEDVMARANPHMDIHVTSLEDALKEQSDKVLNSAMEEFKDYKTKVETLTKRGKPGVKIIEVAEEGNYTLIVMGSRGLGAFSRMMLGSVSNKIVNRVKTSVLIVH